MREIEIKARVGSIAEVLKKIEADGRKAGEPVVQRDQVFGLPGESGGDSNNHAPWLRIRTETKNNHTTYIFTLKKSITNQLDSIEHETEISDPIELEQIILHSGFEPYSDLTKTRRKVKIGDIEICIDAVDDLGEFVEAEKLTDDSADYDTVVSELWQLLETYDISRDAQVTDGYDVLMKRVEGTL
jgi:adenylate cyclase class 2